MFDGILMMSVKQVITKLHLFFVCYTLFFLFLTKQYENFTVKIYMNKRTTLGPLKSGSVIQIFGFSRQQISLTSFLTILLLHHLLLNKFLLFQKILYELKKQRARVFSFKEMNVIPRISDQVLGDQAVSCFFFTKPAWLLAKRIFSIVTNNRENQ